MIHPLSLTLLLGLYPQASPPPAMPDARAGFDEAMRLLAEHHVSEPASDLLYTNALRGMLSGLDAGSPRPANVLLSPAELHELMRGVKGAVSGIGAVIDAVEGVVIVKEVLAGGAAAAAKIQAGDRILSIDGQSVRGLDLQDILGRIRGPSGSRVALEVQRDAEERQLELVRQAIRIESVVGERLEGDVAYVRIRSFSKTTLASLDGLLQRWAARPIAGLILDLRACPGGLFDVALATADRLLPSGAVIVRSVGRAAAETVHRAETEPALDPAVPVVVLVDRDSASGAEILAAALVDHGRATLVGERTLGKGTVERVLELDSGWAIKLTVAGFLSPDGHRWQGVGLRPHFPVPGEAAQRAYSASAKLDPEADGPLKTALSLLALNR